MAYKKLLIATGSQPHTLDVPGVDLDNIFYLRKLNDAREIRRQAEEAETFVVIGGSFIGMETASVLQRSSVETTSERWPSDGSKKASVYPVAG